MKSCFSLSKYFSLVFLENQSYIILPNIDRHINISIKNEEILSLFHDISLKKDYFSREELIEKIMSRGATFNEANELINFLSTIGVLEENSEIIRDNCIIDNTIKDYLSLRHSVRYADYSTPSIFQLDNELMDSYKAEEEIPLTYKEYATLEKRIKLVHPAVCSPSSSFNRLSYILFYCFGRLREFQMLSLTSILKCVPSLGGRHGLEAYIVNYNQDSFLPLGIFHYDVQEHSLVQLDTLTPTKEGEMYLIITVIFERYQWRYRHSWNYKDILYDLGHVHGQLSALSTYLNTCLKEIVPFQMKDLRGYLEEELKEEILSSFDLRSL